MSTRSRVVVSRTATVLGAAALWLFAGGSLVHAAAVSETAVDKTEGRISRTLQYEKDGRSEGRVATGESRDEYPALVSGEMRKGSSSKTQGIQSEGSVTLQSVNYDFWVYHADVILFYDEDNDGYFTGIDLNFDVDKRRLYDLRYQRQRRLHDGYGAGGRLSDRRL